MLELKRKGDPLWKAGASALLILLINIGTYSILRGAYFLWPDSDLGVYAPELEDIGAKTMGYHWLSTGVFLFYAVFSSSTYFWRLGLLSASAGFTLWFFLLTVNRGFEIFPGILTYLFLAILSFSAAIRADDPRPIRALKNHLNDIAVSGSTGNSSN